MGFSHGQAGGHIINGFLPWTGRWTHYQWVSPMDWPVDTLSMGFSHGQAGGHIINGFLAWTGRWTHYQWVSRMSRSRLY